MTSYRLSAVAQADLVDILAWTHRNFGEVARKRYEALLVTALRDISSQPRKAGSIERPELGERVFSWHLRLSRERARSVAGVVRRPRHFLVYRIDGSMVVVGRIMHEAMELDLHFDPTESWE